MYKASLNASILIVVLLSKLKIRKAYSDLEERAKQI